MRKTALMALCFLALGALAVQAENGYAVSSSGRLVEVNLETGERNILATLDRTAFIQALSFAPDGSLFAAGIEDSQNWLYQLSVPGGVLTPVGQLAMSPIGGLSFDRQGRLWLATGTDLYQVNPADGALSLAANYAEPLSELASDGERLLGLRADLEVVAIDLDTFELAVLFPIDLQGWGATGAAIGRDGTLHLTSVTGGILSVIPLALWRVDLDNGTVERTFEEGISFTQPDAGIDSLAIRGGPFANIPTVGTWGLLAIATLLLAAAIALLRRRRLS